MTPGLLLRRSTSGLAALLAVGWVAVAAQEPSSPYKVTIKDEKSVVIETAVPVDPTPRIRFTPQTLGAVINDEHGRTLHLSHFPSFNIDGQVSQNAGFGGAMLGGGRFEKMNQPLGKSAGGKQRQGFTTVYLHNNDLRITFTCEVVPTKAQGNAQKR